MFILRKCENARINVPEPDMLVVPSSTALNGGEPLVLNSEGKATLCTGANMPKFVALGKVGANDSNRTVPAVRISPEQVYECPITATPTSSIVPGAKVTIADRGIGVTTTTTGGVATIVNLNGATKANDKVLVRFE